MPFVASPLRKELYGNLIPCAERCSRGKSDEGKDNLKGSTLAQSRCSKHLQSHWYMQVHGHHGLECESFETHASLGNIW
jgi:hypothetical protein